MSNDQHYRIGEVATLTGVSIDSIRAWEKRYKAVVPARDEKNVRIYSGDDIRRLKLMQQLVDRGARISDIAQLDETVLKERMSREQQRSEVTHHRAVPLVVFGQELTHLFSQMPEDVFRIAATIDQAADWEDAYIPAGATIVINYSLMPYDRLKRLIQGLFNTGPKVVLMLYEFAPSEILIEIRKRGVMTMRMTNDVDELRHALLSRHYWESAGRAESDQYLTEPVPAPMFSVSDLARAKNISKTLACECPSHISALITSLAAFEDYSANCESASLQDAATHAMLRTASGHARATMEAALLRLAQNDGLLDQLYGHTPSTE